jgi:hypothetical protein
MTYEEAGEHCIFKYIGGSHAYGTNVEDSDIDYRGVFIAPLQYYFKLYVGNQPDGSIKLGVETVHETGNDSELQELKKFLKLAADNNPNVIEALWVEKNIIYENDIWKKIRDHRDLFLSKKAKWTFSGYSVAQLRRIKTHRNYILNPPKKHPEREDYGLPVDCKMPKELQGSILTISDDWFSDEMREVARKEKQYTIDMNAWVAYQDWRKNRNPKRQITEDKFGFDAKHALHLVRLINMAKEILTDCKMTVYRPDRELLIDIRNGKWSYEQLEKYAEESEKELEKLYETSKLRNTADYIGIENLYQEICEEHYKIKIVR